MLLTTGFYLFFCKPVPIVEVHIFWLFIQPKNFFSDCSFSFSALEYIGVKNRSKNNQLCMNWSTVLNYLTSINNTGSTGNHVFDWSIVDNSENHCRNPDIYFVGGPWCFVNRSSDPPATYSTFDRSSCAVDTCG